MSQVFVEITTRNIDDAYQQAEAFTLQGHEVEAPKSYDGGETFVVVVYMK